jgi:hypothetical protein
VSADSTEARSDALEHEATVMMAVVATKTQMGLLFLGFVFAAFGVSLFLLIFGHTRKEGSRGVIIPITRLLWLTVLSYPPATFLMFIVLPPMPSGAEIMAVCSAWLMLIAFFALIVGYRTKWVNSLFLLLLISIGAILAGQIIGGPLNEPGYLSYDITEGSRYYGMGNEQCAIIFGAWLTFSGLLINRFPQAKSVIAFRRWGFLLGSFVLLFVVTSPWLGASFGPLVWGSFGMFLAWWLFNQRRLKWWFFLLALIVSGAIAIGVLCLDIQFDGHSHMGHYRGALDTGLWTMIMQVIQSAWQTSVLTIVNYMPALAILFVVLIITFLVILRLFKPGTYREFWGRNKAYSATYVVGFIIALITFCLEDSGLFTPAVFLIYPVSGFVWLVCDMHAWHLRELREKNKPVSIKELLHEAFETETYQRFAAPMNKLHHKRDAERNDAECKGDHDDSSR